MIQSLSDDERREVLGEVLMDELKAIHEYVQDIPLIKKRLKRVEAKIDSINSRLSIVEYLAKEHDQDLRRIKLKTKLA